MDSTFEQYLWPDSPPHALELLGSQMGQGALLAGGTSFFLQYRAVNFVVDISRLGFSGIQTVKSETWIGATTTLQEGLTTTARAGLPKLLVTSLREIRSEPFRRQSTFGGALHTGDAQLAAALCCLDAEVEVLFDHNRKKPRRLKLLDYLKLKPEPGMLLHVILPPAESNWCFATETLKRSALDRPVGSVTVGLKQEDQDILDARVFACGLGPHSNKVIHGSATEKALVESTPRPSLWQTVQKTFALEIDPISDHRASKEYRQHLAGVLLARALQRAATKVDLP